MLAPTVEDPESNENLEGSTDFAQINAVYRRKTFDWLQGQPLDFMYLARLVMEPLRVLMQKQFQTCSEQWELGQRSKVARFIMSGGTEEQGHRSYMLTLAASGELENQYLAQVQFLLADLPTWQIISDQNRTVEFNHLCFKKLTRGGCLIEANIGLPHRQMPYKVFNLLENPERGPEMSGTPPCCLDPFTKGLLQTFPNFAGDDCRHTLDMVAKLASTNIASIESKHSSIRRHSILRSTQTWGQQVKDLSAAWTLQQFRRAKVSASKCKPTGSAITTSTSKVRQC